MTLKDAICTTVANQLNHEMERRGHYGFVHPNLAIPVHPNDVEEIEFVWDEGETSDNEDYGLTPRLPSMEIRVVVKAVGARPQQWHTISAGAVFTALLQAIMREGL